MSNKKRKLAKEKERTQLTIQKQRKSRSRMCLLLAIIAIVAVATFALRILGFNVPLDAMDVCITAALLAVACVGPILRIIWNNKQIRAAATQVAETDQRIRDWEERLQAM